MSRSEGGGFRPQVTGFSKKDLLPETTALVADLVSLAADQSFEAVNPIIRPDLPELVNVGTDLYVLLAGCGTDVVVTDDLQALSPVRDPSGVCFG